MTTLHFPTRGATVALTSDTITIDRDLLAAALWPSLERPVADIEGWEPHPPGPYSPGTIELYFRDLDAATPLHFSPGQLGVFTGLHSTLRDVHAGYPLDDTALGRAAATGADGAPEATAEDEQAAAAGTGAASASVSMEAWIAEAVAAEEAEQLELFAADFGEQGTGAGSAGAAGATGAGTAGAKKSSRPKAPWERVATPDVIPEPNPDADMANPLYGQVVCFSGEHESLSKGDMWRIAADHGATVAKNVTKKTTLLVVASWHEPTSKEKRARELQDKGQAIEIISIEDFLAKTGDA